MSKWVFRSSVRLRSRHSDTHAERSFNALATFSSCATAMKDSSAAFASETMPKSGAKTRPICVGSMSTCTNVRPLL